MKGSLAGIGDTELSQQRCETIGTLASESRRSVRIIQSKLCRHDGHAWSFDSLKVVLHHNTHPPLVQSDSWTVAAPFKEQKHVRTAVESIANNFSPQAQRLDIRKLPQAKQGVHYPGDGYYRGGKTTIHPHLTLMSRSPFYLEKGRQRTIALSIQDRKSVV